MTARSVGRRDALEGAGEVLDVNDRAQRVDDVPVDQEVDVDRRVVLGDRRLAGDLDELLADVDLLRLVDDRNQEAQAWTADELWSGVAEAEDDHPLVLLDDADRQIERDEAKYDDRGDDRESYGVHLVGVFPF